ncbi:MAG: metallophosphoesterase family protein [Actinobacteria bacterium]|nr:MAG: metallophosphoesterase family protein [Actinomycetota bacterium]
MRVAALYDIHGNFPALEPVLEEVEREEVDAIVLGGDCIHGPQPVETLARLRSLGERALWIRGNTDRLLAGDESSDDLHGFVAAALGDEDAAWLGALPLTQRLEVDGLGDVLFCHATPRDDEEIVTPLTPDERLASILEGVHADVVVTGHTHMQQDRTVAGIRWVNAGSVGLPYEDDIQAFWALLGPDVDLRRTPFDASAAIAAFEAVGREDAARFAENFRSAPSRREAAEYFESLV